MDETPSSLLDLASLGYDGGDNPARREQAAALLRAHPDWPAQDPFVAAATGDLAALKDHLRQDPTLVRQTRGESRLDLVLQLCASRVLVPGSDAEACLELLLSAGAAANTRFEHGMCRFSAVTCAIGHGEGGPINLPPHPSAEALVRRLLAAGASPNDPQALYNTMLSPGNGWLKLLLEHGLKPEHTIDWDMSTEQPPRCLDFVLCHAAEKGDLGRMTLLLDHGADPNAKSPYNGRACHTNARLQGHLEAAELLIERGAIPPPLSPPEAFRLEVFQGDPAQVRQLLAASPDLLEDPTLLIEAAERSHLPALDLLLDLGAAPNAPGQGGACALHKAAWNGDLTIIDRLLSAGADKTLKDQTHGGTPADWARHAGQSAALQRLDESK